MTGADPARRALALTGGARAEDATTAVVPKLRVERLRTAVDGCAWASIALGLAFTTVNVQEFGAATAAVYSPSWWVAWLLDPIPSLLLIAVLLTEQVTARWQIQLGGWVAVTKWATFAATAGMNTWSAFAAGSGADIFKHVVPPLMVFLGAQVAPMLRDALTAAVTAATAAQPTSTSTSTSRSTAPTRLGPQADRSALDASPGEAIHAGTTSPGLDRPPPASAADGRPVTGAGPHRQVAELARRLAAGERLTGPTAAAALGCSERNARRLLAEARELDTPDPATDPGRRLCRRHAERGEAGRARGGRCT